MTSLEHGARRIEEVVRERAQARAVAITQLSWNGDEGLTPGRDTQTLVLTATQSQGRATFTEEQITTTAEFEIPAAASQVIDRLIADCQVAADSGTHPRGGSG